MNPFKLFKLLANWKSILLKAWSIRLWVLAALFETAGIVLPLFMDSMSKITFSVLSLIAAAGGIWARLIEQRALKQ